MASSSISSSLNLLIFCTIILLVKPITSYPLDNICKQTKNQDLCFKLLKPHSNASLQEVDQIVFITTTAKVTLTGAKILSFLSQTKDQNLRTVYTLCSNHYRSALAALDTAKEKLKSGEYRDVNDAAVRVSMDASACKEGFSNAPHKYIPIANDNNNVDLLADVVHVVSMILVKGGKRTIFI